MIEVVPATGRPSALVLHSSADVLEALTRALHTDGLDIVAAASAFRAKAALEGNRTIDVVVAPWDLGGDLYRWALAHRPDLRSRFVFIADDVPAEFDNLVAGRCITVPLAELGELARATAAIARRRPSVMIPALKRDKPIPTLLLVEDDAMMLEVMAELLGQQGYAVTPVDRADQATEVLELRDFDAIVVDWRAKDVYRWIIANKPALGARVVFLAENDQDAASVAPDRPMFRKGQDSQALVDVLRDITAR
jgi:CheY-like chemotaxis protein